ncbi:MAG: CopG family antitoxin [Pseudonocardiaceae bacterium]
MDPKQLHNFAEYYDTADLTEQIERTNWEETEPATEPMVTYALRLPKPVIDQIRDAAEVRGVKVSALMREWLQERLILESEPGEDVTVPVSALLALVAERGTRRNPRTS